ncbi:MAG: UDP-N-acetylmuramoyl-L-alanine--D-glutamate ligase [Bacteroidales bacterium]
MNKEVLNNLIFNKKVLILGFGKEGRSTYQFLRLFFPHQLFYIADQDLQLSEKYKFNEDEEVELKLGDSYLNSLSDYDLIIKTPGISLKHLNSIEVGNLQISSQTDLFLQLFSRQIIGITGTKGKSTTTNLIFHILKSFTENAIMVGNMGFPPFDQHANINDETFIVFEMSSHQLENCKIAPHYAILLNLFQEHLDHYQTYMDYQMAKFNIAKYQQSDDFFICNADNVEINTILKGIRLQGKLMQFSLARKVNFGCFVKRKSIYFIENKSIKVFFDFKQKRILKGEHNLLNIMAAINVCKLIGVPDNLITEGISSFKGLEHRMEFVGKFNGIDFYNDSISTIPEATIAAVNALNIVDTLILGGFDRGIEYFKLAEYLVKSDVKNLIFIGVAGKRIFDEVKKLDCFKIQCFEANSFEEAVRLSIRNTKKRKICLLSPAAASYDTFKNFEERGKRFKELVSNEL